MTDEAIRAANKAAHLRDLDEFDRYHSAAGRLRRYCAGRIRTLPARVGVALIGVTILTVLVSPAFGAAVAAITLVLEGAEVVILRRQMSRDAFEDPRTGRVITAAAAIQAIGIAIPIFAAGIQSDEMRFVAWAFAIGATINAMLGANYHRASYAVRQAMLAAAICGVMGVGLMSNSVEARVLVTECVGMLVMVLMLTKLFTHIARRENRIVATERDLISKSADARRLALVAEHAIDSVMLLDPDRRIRWVNPHFTKMTGYTAAEALGMKPSDLLNHPDTDLSAVAEIEDGLKAGNPANTLILNRGKDGRDIWVDVHQTPLHDESGQLELVISVERDATERVRAAEALSNALEDAKAADAAKSDFLSRMSHELRTPANGIVGGADLLLETDLDAQQGEIAGMIQDSAGRMMRLVDDILSYSEISSHAVVKQSSRIDIGALLSALADEIRPECAAKGLSLEVDVGPCPICVESDALLLRRLLDRLCANAVKFTETGGVFLGAHHDGEKLLISVRDTGIGIDASMHDRVFERFVQVDGARTRAHDGAGIGLTLARKIARLLGGTITVAAAPGMGSTFTFELAVPQLAAVNGTKRDARALALLIAEDNKTNRLLLEKMFRGGPHSLEFAHDGQEAIEKYAAAPPDVVLMDLSMPKKDGIEATRDIRRLEADRHWRHCPIVAVTANASDADRRVCYEAGMDGFLSKPVRKARLFAAIEEACNSTAAAE